MADTEATGATGATDTGEGAPAYTAPEHTWHDAGEREFWERAFLVAAPLLVERPLTTSTLDALNAGAFADAALAERRRYACAHLSSTGDMLSGYAKCDACGVAIDLRTRDVRAERPELVQRHVLAALVRASATLSLDELWALCRFKVPGTILAAGNVEVAIRELARYGYVERTGSSGRWVETEAGRRWLNEVGWP
jgi:hypothetical protein